MNLPETLYGVGDMEYMKINRGVWDPEIAMLFVDLPTISLNIFFGPQHRGNKWLVWGKVYSVYVNNNPTRMMGKTRKPPIRNLERFMRGLIMNFPIKPSNTDNGSYMWLWNERKRIENK
jgi:hypothetical protein